MIEQVAVNTLVGTASITLIALSFAMVFQVSPFLNFAHGAVFATGPYAVIWLTEYCGWPTWLGVTFGLAIAASLGLGFQGVVFERLSERGASRLVLLLASLGLYVVMQNIFSLGFGDETRVLRGHLEGSHIVVHGGVVSAVQLAMICVAVVVTGGLSGWLQCSRAGRAVRSIASDVTLATIVGLPVQRIRFAWVGLGSALAGLAGILVAFDTDVRPTMAMSPLMYAVVCVVLAGANRPLAVFACSSVLACVQQVSGYYLGTEWRDAVAMTCLLLVLVYRRRNALILAPADAV